MKKLLLIFLIPVFSFTQNGDTNGDGIVNLSDLFTVLDYWLQSVNENDPEAISTSSLDELTNLVDSLITLNQNVNYGRGYDMFFPDGYNGEPVTVDISNQGEVFSDIPEGKNLYITNLYTMGSISIKINDIEVAAENFSSIHTGNGQMLQAPLILGSGDEIYNANNNDGSSFNGFLIASF